MTNIRISTLEHMMVTYGMNFDLATKVTGDEYSYDIQIQKTALNKIFNKTIRVMADSNIDQVLEQVEKEIRNYLDSINKERIQHSILIGKPIYQRD